MLRVLARRGGGASILSERRGKRERSEKKRKKSGPDKVLSFDEHQIQAIDWGSLRP